MQSPPPAQAGSAPGQQSPLLPHPHLQQAPLLPHPQMSPPGFAGPPPPGFPGGPHGHPHSHPHHQFQPPMQHQFMPPPQQQQQQPPHGHSNAQSSPSMHPSHHHSSHGPPPMLHPQAPAAAPEHDPFLQHVVSASLVDLLGKQILVLLRDGRKLIGELLSFDQYSNIVVSGASERKVIGNQYYDDPLGLYVIRGENVVLLGDQQPSRLSKHSPPIEFKAVSKPEFALLEAEEKKKESASGSKKSAARGGEEDDLM